MPKDKLSTRKQHDKIDRHKQLMQAYLKKVNTPLRKSYVPPVYRTERDIIRENHKFVRSEDDDNDSTWEQRVAKKYYDRLYKEYALGNLKYYKEGKIALRWRTEKEVVSGKGQFFCGSISCDETKHLRSWEVNFGYMEDGLKKNELVKVRLCEDCSDKLNYKTKMKRAKREKHRKDKTKDADADNEKHDSNDKRSKPETENTPDDDVTEKETSVWRQKVETKQEQSREEEYEDYFADLLQ